MCGSRGTTTRMSTTSSSSITTPTTTAVAKELKLEVEAASLHLIQVGAVEVLSNLGGSHRMYRKGSN